MKREAKRLAVRAKQHISICCKTLCEREIVEEYIQQLEDKVAELVAIRSLGPDVLGNDTPIRKLTIQLQYGHMFGAGDEQLESHVAHYWKELQKEKSKL